MLLRTRGDRILWSAFGSIVLAAVLFFASSRETGANPPGSCPGCPRQCLEIPCDNHAPPELSCRGGKAPEKDDGCRNSGTGKIGYDFTCKIDPKFNDFGTAGCKDQDPCKLPENPPNGASFSAEIQVDVAIAACGQEPVKRSRVWRLTRVVTAEDPCPGTWKEGEATLDPPAVSEHVWLPASCDCSKGENHLVTITVDVWVIFDQRCLVMTGRPECEALVTDTIFKCL
ncbi:MAG: hypothetical protein ACUVYA_12675 [Planctomycetota bacterium]